MRLTNLEELAASFSQWQGQLEQTSSGRFDGTLYVASGKLVRVMKVVANQCVRVRGREAAGMFSAFLIADEKSATLWQGRQLTRQQVAVCGVDTDMDHFTGRRVRNLGVTLRPEVVLDAARALLNSDDITLPPAWAMVAPSPDTHADFESRLARLLDRGVADSSLLETTEGFHLEQDCVRSLVFTLFSGTAPQSSPPLPARSRILRRAEELMRSRLADPLGAIDLCRELGINDRTLRLAFQERYGVGPMTYYRFLRLNAVRSQLKTHREISIADAAREFGFHHLGNFAADYRRLFGMRPSETERTK